MQRLDKAVFRGLFPLLQSPGVLKSQNTLFIRGMPTPNNFVISCIVCVSVQGGKQKIKHRFIRTMIYGIPEHLLKPLIKLQVLDFSSTHILGFVLKREGEVFTRKS